MNYDNLTDEQLATLLRLEREELYYQRLQKLSNPTKENASPNYLALHDAISTQVWGKDEDGLPVLESGYAGYILEGSSRCFDGSQLVVTNNGSKPIQDINQSDEILTYNERTGENEYKPVLNKLKFTGNEKKCVKITMKSGSTIKSTEDHEFYHNGEWLPISKALSSGWLNSKLPDWESYEEIELDCVYDLSIQSNNNYYLGVDGKQILVHNSTKTWAGVDIIIWLCTERHAKDGCTINIYRETYNEFKTTLYDDFKRRLNDYDLDNPFERKDEVKSFKIGKSKIHFLGDGKHGGGCDYAFYNEAMFLRNEVFDQSEMRCRKFWWMDYNPSFTQHWVFDKVEPRHDVGFLRTTFRDNKFISATELNKILGYEPWKSGSYEVTPDGRLLYQGRPIDKKNQPPPHEKNVEQGTADEFMWKCYGLGLRGAMKGVILTNVKYISEDEVPQGLAFTVGVDYGFVSDPSAIGEYAKRGKKVYFRPKWYTPTETASEMDKALKFCGIKKNTPITGDSSDRYTSEKKGTTQMTRELFAMGWRNIHKVSKTKGLTYWLTDLKEYEINIIVDKTAPIDTHEGKMYKAIKTEVDNYKWDEVNGILINQPIDDFNHFIDCMRYAHMARRQVL